MYKDSQLPRPNTFKPISPPTLPMETTMAELIDDENKWDETKLNQFFYAGRYRGNSQNSSSKKLEGR